MDYATISKETISCLEQCTASLNNSPLSQSVRVLVELRISQMNGCAYCCSLHSEEARKLNIPQEKIDVLPGWQVSSLFKDEERAALQWCESVTRLDKDLEKIRKQLFHYYTERQIVDLTCCIAIMNAWNRIAISLEEGVDRRPVLPENPDPIVYKGMTVNQLTEACDDYKAIPNFDVLLQENRERAQTVKARLNPIHNVAYGTEIIQKLDIYAPENAKNMPVLISIHGGGWTMGSKNPWAIPAEILMSKGIISVSIDHGLAPQYRMDDIIAHVRHAVAWVYKNIAQYGGDPNCLYIYGMSAGAHLASTTLMTSWHKDFDLPEDVIKGLVAMSGIYDLCTLVYAPQTDSQKALQMTLEESRRDSPFYHLPQHSIPSIIAYGEKEPLILYHLEATNYAQKLQKAGCNVSLIEVPGANHFDMINELTNTQGQLFKAVEDMLNGRMHG